MKATARFYQSILGSSISVAFRSAKVALLSRSERQPSHGFRSDCVRCGIALLLSG